MGARVESLPIPVGRPGKGFNWLVVAVLAVSMGAAASIFALQRGAREGSAPPLSVAKAAEAPALSGTGSGLIQLANASGNTTGHSLAYFTGAGGAINSMANDSGHSMAWFTARMPTPDLAAYASSGLISGSGPALSELAGKDLGAYESSGRVIGTGPGLAELGPNDRTCRRILRPRC
jgi:hypothetical protein